MCIIGSCWFDEFIPKVGTRGYNKKGEDPLKWLPSLPQVKVEGCTVLCMYVNLCDLLLQKRTKPDWQDVSPEFKLFPGVTKDMIGAEQRPHTNTVSGLPSLLRPPVNKGRQLGMYMYVYMYMYMYLHVAKETHTLYEDCVHVFV